ncbi:hypothetical protein B5X24_HaOG200768 [Helicoverpa armigera]|uniref:Uncharacterized protein n=1 Tax=Helicoverpa armigera TaxID=29058 RepID=A0A2W1BTX2_HELAM|nr:hypothetical protein B5X24_HaOG200768 [Helicoverpa armigera]
MLDALLLGMVWAFVAGIITFVQRLEIITFCKYIDLLRRRLQIINQYLKTFANEQDSKYVTVFTMESETIKTKETVNFIGNASESNTKIRDLAQMYGMIGHTCSMVGKIFSLQILTILMSVFILLITIMYSKQSHRLPNFNGCLWSNGKCSSFIFLLDFLLGFHVIQM